MRGRTVGHHQRTQTEACHQDNSAQSEDGPVKRQPLVGVHQADGSNGRQGRQRDGDCDSQYGADHKRYDDTAEDVARCHGRSGSERAQHSAICGVASDEAAQNLPVDHKGRQSSDDTEDTERDCLRSNRAFRCRHDRRGRLETSELLELRHDAGDTGIDCGGMANAAV